MWRCGLACLYLYKEDDAVRPLDSVDEYTKPCVASLTTRAAIYSGNTQPPITLGKSSMLSEKSSKEIQVRPLGLGCSRLYQAISVCSRLFLEEGQKDAS